MTPKGRGCVLERQLQLKHPMKRLALHQWHIKHGARMVESGGWQVPAAYTDVEREIAAARTGLALADISAFAKVSLVGAGVAELARELTHGDAALLPRRVAGLAGPGDVLACRIAEDHLLLLARTTNPAVLDARLAEVGPAVVPNDAAMYQAGFCLVGPRLEEVLRQVTGLDVSSVIIPTGSCAQTGVAGVPALLVRPPECSVPSAFVHVSWDLAEYVWERLLEAGAEAESLGLDGLRALGLAAM